MRRPKGFMYRIGCLLLAVGIAFGVIPTARSHADDGITYVRVLLSTEGAKSLSVPVTGTYTLSESGTTFSDGQLSIEADGNNVSVTHTKLGRLYSGAAATFERMDMSRDAGGLTLPVVSGVRTFLGHMTFTAKDGVLSVVNRVPIQQYLYGVVGYEMSNEFPVEALKAQAVAARNYVLLHLKASKRYDIGDTASDQVYKGYDPESTNVIAACDATAGDVLLYNGRPLVCYYAASNGGWMILPGTRWGDTSIDGAYASGSDPYDMKNPSTPFTELPLPETFAAEVMGTRAHAFIDSRILESVAAKGFVPDEFHFGAVSSIDDAEQSGQTGYKNDKNFERFTVRASVRLERDAKTIPSPTPSFAPTASPTPAIVTPSPTPEPVTPSPTPEIDPTVEDAPTPTPIVGPASPTPVIVTPSPTPEPEPTPSPTPALTLSLTKPVTVTFTIEELLNAKLLQSSSLKIVYAEATDAGYRIVRCRYGHGVGMSQRGAQQMALEGRNYKEILKFYYPGATLSTSVFVSPEGKVNRPNAGASTGTPSGIVTGATVNLRAGASTDTDILAALPAGTPLTLLGIDGSFYRVSTADGQTGYAHSDYVLLTGSAPIASGTVNTASVNCRTGAGTDFASLGQLDAGTRLNIFGIVSGWYKVAALEETLSGYIRADLVTLSGAGPIATAIPQSSSGALPAPTPIPGGTAQGPIIFETEKTPVPVRSAPPTPTPIPVFAAQGTIDARSVPLYKGASSLSARVAVTDGGTSVGIYEKCGAWYRVTVLPSGENGYVHERYVRLTDAEEHANGDPTNGRTAAVWRGYITESGTKLRLGADIGADAVDTLKRNAAVAVLGSDGSWLRVKVTSSGLEGYVLSRSVDMQRVKGASDQQRVGVVAAQRVELRTAASAGAIGRVIGTLERGAAVSVDSVVNGWCRVVSEDGLVGFCESARLRIG